MSSLRSSVRPKSSKQPWGTVIHPEFGMGYQKMTAYEIDQTVNRLHCNKETRDRVDDQQKNKDLDRDSVHQMVNRLRKDTEKNVIVDSNRTQTNSMYKDMGVVNSYAWKGYN